MGQIHATELETRAAAIRELLSTAVREHERVVYANSLGAEAMVLTDILCTHVPEVDIVTIDTGRLHEETHALLEKLQHRYGNRIRVIYPDAGALSDLVARHGINGFFQSAKAREACCNVRKVVPFRQITAGYRAWVTGVRREQSQSRAQSVPVEWDAQHGLFKLSPLLEWTEEQVWSYIRARKVPYNALHDRDFPSIGCAPCTRAVLPGESQRAGRWWWESAESRECGLHPRQRPAMALA